MLHHDNGYSYFQMNEKRQIVGAISFLHVLLLEVLPMHFPELALIIINVYMSWQISMVSSFVKQLITTVCSIFLIDSGFNRIVFLNHFSSSICSALFALKDNWMRLAHWKCKVKIWSILSKPGIVHNDQCCFDSRQWQHYQVA